MGWNYLSIPNLQRSNRWSLRMDRYFHLTLYKACTYLSMLGWKLNHVSKRGHCSLLFISFPGSCSMYIYLLLRYQRKLLESWKIDTCSIVQLLNILRVTLHRGIADDINYPCKYAGGCINIEHRSKNTTKHIEAETRGPPFSRRHFQMHFLE